MGEILSQRLTSKMRRSEIAIFGSPRGFYRQILIELDLSLVALKGAGTRPSTCFTSAAGIARRSLITAAGSRADPEKVGEEVWGISSL